LLVEEEEEEEEEDLQQLPGLEGDVGLAGTFDLVHMFTR